MGALISVSLVSLAVATPSSADDLSAASGISSAPISKGGVEGPEGDISVEDAYASDHAVSVDQARQELQREAEILDLVPAINKAVPNDRLGGLVIDRQSGVRVKVRLTAGPPIDALNKLADKHDFIDVSSDASVSVAARVAAVDQASRVWMDKIPNLDGIYVDEASDNVVLMIRDEALGEPTKQTLGAEAGDYLLQGYNVRSPNEPGLELVVESSAGASDGNRGGRDLYSCTSGFIVLAPGGAAMLTAGHCANYQPWYGWGGGGPYATSRVAQHYNTYADLAWYHLETSHNFAPRAYYEYTSNETNQKDNGTNVQGASACHRGKTTNFTCGTIMNVQYKPTYSGACPGGPCETRFVLAGDLEGQPGDSGGPVWTTGIVPVGIYKGQNSETGTNSRIWWTKLGNMPSGMDIWVA